MGLSVFLGRKTEMQNHCDHSIVNGKGCIVIYDSEECPLCVLKRKQEQENEVHKIELSFTKLKDGTCNIFADIFSFDNILQLTAEQAHFVSVKLFNKDDDKHVLLNVPYKTLVNFSAKILDYWQHYGDQNDQS